MNRLLAMVLAVSALALVPRIASASCGDWLQHPPPTEGEAAQPDVRPDAPASPLRQELAGATPGRSPAAPCECEGPACRPAPAGPASPAGPDSVVPSDPQPAWLVAGGSEAEVGRSRRARERRVALSEGFAPGIERPPRR